DPGHPAASCPLWTVWSRYFPSWFGRDRRPGRQYLEILGEPAPDARPPPDLAAGGLGQLAPAHQRDGADLQAVLVDDRAADRRDHRREVDRRPVPGQLAQHDRARG